MSHGLRSTTAYLYKKACRADRRRVLDAQQQRALEAIDKGETKKLFAIIKVLRRPKQLRSYLGPLDEAGVLTFDYQDQRLRWQRHFSALLDGDVTQRATAETSAQLPAAFVFDSSIAPTVVEVEEVIVKQGSGRAPGEDGLVAQLSKVDSAATARLLHSGSAVGLAWRCASRLVEGQRTRPQICFVSWHVLARRHQSAIMLRLLPFLNEHAPPSQSGSLSGLETGNATLNLRSLKASAACMF